MKKLSFSILLLFLVNTIQAQQPVFTHADTLRGSITPQRVWWKVVYYDLNVSIQPKDSTIRGYNNITYRVKKPVRKLQIDLQQPLQIDQITQEDKTLSYHRVSGSNAYFIEVPKNLKQGSMHTISVYYHGHPKVAKNPPWDGGFIWRQDSLGNKWVATANQGLGASVWWPNKDHQSAEPDSMSINITVPESMVEVSNGRLRNTIHHQEGTTTWSWFVTNPINNYNVAVNAGNYVNFTDTLEGKSGILDLSYWVLQQNLKKAKKQFQQVKPMLRCFEKWFGPYPFYEDSFKLVETPHLGMEHQSAVGYGNGYKNGYRGRDLSGTGWGFKWDFIIIHESGHEWWGNSITTKDIADMWVHEGFTSYSESIYTECQFGKKAGAEYVIGLRERIQNNRPVIGTYGVNSEGSGDMYYKGSNMLHTIRQIVNNDSAWKSTLHGLQQKFYHQTVTSQQVEQYMNDQIKYDLGPVFDQYLRHTGIPELRYYFKDNYLYYRWKADVADFDMPVKVSLKENSYFFIYPDSEKWQKTRITLSDTDTFKVDKNFYIASDSVDNRAPFAPKN